VVADKVRTRIERYLAHRVERVSVATANRDLRTLKASLNRAVRRGYLQSSPATRIGQVLEAEKSVRVLTPAEGGSLLDASPSAMSKASIALSVTTGIQRGEVLALAWQDADVEGCILQIRSTPSHATKSRRNRVLALMPEVAKLLSRLPR
jgi:integrase